MRVDAENKQTLGANFPSTLAHQFLLLDSLNVVDNPDINKYSGKFKLIRNDWIIRVQ